MTSSWLMNTYRCQRSRYFFNLMSKIRLTSETARHHCQVALNTPTGGLRLTKIIDNQRNTEPVAADGAGTSAATVMNKFGPRIYISKSNWSLQWRHNEHEGVSHHRRLDYLLCRLFKRRWEEKSKLHVTGLCEGNSPVTGEFSAQRASNAENASFWWRHHVSVQNHKDDHSPWL